MIFASIKSEIIFQQGFRWFQLGTLACALASLLGAFSGSEIQSIGAGLVYFFVVIAASRSAGFQANPLALLFCEFTFLFMNVPVAFILARGSAYIFGEGVIVAITQESIRGVLPGALLFLTVITASAMYGMALVRIKPRLVNLRPMADIGEIPVLILVLIVVVLSYLQGLDYGDAKGSGIAPGESLISFLFFDHACWILVGVFLFAKANDTGVARSANKAANWMAVYFLIFVSQHAYNGSKAAVYVTIIFVVLVPMSQFRLQRGSSSLFLTKGAIAAVLLMAIPLYYFSMIKRVSMATGEGFDVSAALGGVSMLGLVDVTDLIDTVFYRFAMGGFDRFLLVYQSFISDTPEFSYRIEYSWYLFESSINLITPGTPFPESYAPSSQLFPFVIERGSMEGRYEDATSLIAAMNTQPYTGYGVFMICFGFLSPLVTFLFMISTTLALRRFASPLLVIATIYFFHGFLSSYGLDAVIGNTFHLVVSMAFLYVAAHGLTAIANGYKSNALRAGD